MNLKQAKLLLENCAMADQVLLIEGVHGIGKSDIVREFSKDNNLHNETLILSLMDVGDLIGIPRTAEVGGQVATVWSAPAWFNRIVDSAWPRKLEIEALEGELVSKLVDSTKATVSREELNHAYCEYMGIPNNGLQLHIQSDIVYTKGKRSVLFLDEMNRSPVDVLNSSLQLILDKRLNDHVLPLGTVITAAINPADGAYTTMEFDPALLDRFVSVKVEPDIKAFISYAKSVKAENIIIDFLLQSPKYLHSEPKNGGKGSTPRSWMKLNKYLKAIKNPNDEVFTHALKGILGDVVASEFLIYYNNYSKAISADDIIKAVNKSKITDVEKMAEKVVSKIIKDQEAIQLSEMAEKLESKFLEGDVADAMPYLAYLYAIPQETLSSYTQQLKEDMKKLKKVAEIDDHFNDKQLFKRMLVLSNKK